MSVSMSVYEGLFFKALSPMKQGELTVSLPGGGTRSIGTSGTGVRARIDVRDSGFFRKCALFGDIGFGEAYTEGLWDSPDVAAVIAWAIANVESAPTLSGSRRSWSPVNWLGALNRVAHLMRPNSLGRAGKNIRDHYDYSNDFFKLWLDPSMTYSSAWFESKDSNLEQAQMAKYDRLLSRLQLRPGMQVLEIGSGWGGFAIRAAREHGVRVLSLTLSQRQLEEARRRAEEAGVSGQVEFRLEDYRRTEGTFDRIVSIEMIEAVGHDYYEEYFSQCHRLLRPDGLLALQGILCPDTRYDQIRARVDWIQRHVFPGSLLPSFGRIHGAIRRTGDLDLVWFEEMGLHYGKTLRQWDRALRARQADALQMGYTERDLRHWSYYFLYCAAAFEMRNITVAQMVFSRPNNLSNNSYNAGSGGGAHGGDA